MYQVEASKALLRPKLWARRSARLNVPRNVVMLGMVSMLTDVSSEMVATILPLYLVFSLGASPLALGAIDGTYRGAAALVQVASGFLADRWRKPKEVAGAGYGISAVGKVALVAAGNTIGGIGAIVAFDRIGKGIRTAPRDALISLSSSKAARRARPLRRRLRRQHPLRPARRRRADPHRSGQAETGSPRGQRALAARRGRPGQGPALRALADRGDRALAD
jgi:hypothetical protein